MTNVHILYPEKSDLILLYEVVEKDGAVWGGGSRDAVTWYRYAPAGSRMIVTAWDSDEEDAHLVGRPIDITDIVSQAIGRENK